MYDAMSLVLDECFVQTGNDDKNKKMNKLIEKTYKYEHNQCEMTNQYSAPPPLSKDSL